jgi:hypothetical protein
MALAVPTCSSSPDILPYPWITATALTPGVQPVSGFSVLVLLVVLAGFFLLITRRYPRALFDLLVGVNRGSTVSSATSRYYMISTRRCVSTKVRANPPQSTTLVHSSRRTPPLTVKQSHDGAAGRRTGMNKRRCSPIGNYPPLTTGVVRGPSCHYRSG